MEVSPEMLGSIKLRDQSLKLPKFQDQEHLRIKSLRYNFKRKSWKGNQMLKQLFISSQI